MRGKKNFVVIGTVAAMAMSVLGAVNVSAADGVTLSLYMNADDLAKPYIQKIISLYEEESGNKIDQQGLDRDSAENIALTKFTTGDIPDIYVHFGNSNLSNFNPIENFVDFTDADWVADIEDSILPQATYDDEVIGLPFWEASHSGCLDYIADDFGIMPIFMGTCDEGTYEGGNVNLFMANKNGERVKEATEFINFMADPDNYNKAFEGISTAAVFKGQTTNVNSAQYEENKENVDKLIRASCSPKIVGYNGTEGGKALLQVMSGDISVEECIELIDNDRIATLESFAK